MSTGFKKITKRLTLFTIDNLIWFIDLVLIIFFATRTTYNFLTWGNLISILYAVSALGFLVYAQAIALISGNFDMSVGAIAAFSATMIGMLYGYWLPGLSSPLLILLLLTVGAAVGMFNGIFITRIGVNPFLQTLSSYILLYGITIGITGRTLFNLPEGLLMPGSLMIGDIPLAVIILIAGVIALHLFSQKIPLGRRIYAVGSNREAAEVCGINVHNTIIYAMMLSGILSAMGGLLYTGYMRCVPMGMAREALFLSFAGAIIGGVSIKGGYGKISNVFGGILLLGIIEIGLTTLRLPASWREALNGIILMVAILVNTSQIKLKRYVLTW